MRTIIRRHGPAWGLAGTSLALALLLTLTLEPLHAHRPYLLFFPAIMVCAWWGGLPLALGAMVLSAVAVHVWIVAPDQVWAVTLTEAVQIGTFVVVAGGMSGATSALVAARTRFAVTLASIGDAVLVTDRQGRVTFLNAVAAALTGWTPQAAAGRDLTDVLPLVHMSTRQAVDNPVTRVLRDGHVVGLATHTLLIAKDGTERPIDASGAPIWTPAGEILGVVLVFRDVTARQQAEAVRARLAALVESSDAAIIGTTLDGIITDWNPGAERLYGSTAAAMVGQSIARLIPPDLPDDLPALLARLRRGDRIDHYETQRVAKDGTRRAVALTLSPIRDDAGQLVGASKIARDITARKQAEAELERRRQETALVAAIAQDLSTSLDLDTVLQRVVTGAQTLCRSARAFLSLRDPGTTALVGRYEVGAPRAGYAGLRLPPGQGLGAQVLRTGRPWRTADYIADPRFSKVSVVGVRAGGHLAMLAVPILRDGQVAGVLYVSNPTTQPFTDRDEAILVRLAAHAAIAIQNAQLYQQAQTELTERQRAEAALAQAAAALEQRVAERTAQLEAANHELEAFSYSVSHDLRAPLRAIQGFTRLLRDQHAPHLPDQAQHYLRRVQDSAQHMGQLIEDLLAFARLSRQPLTTQPVALADLVRQALSDLRAMQGERPLDVRIGALPVCQADPALLKQVVINLLANALKFTSRREAAVIDVGWRQEQGEVIYFVRDNGVGFDMAYADKLFGVFQRLHRTDEYEGTGVGLAIVQRIIQRHGGRIWAEAAVDQGATFFFTLGRG